MPKYSHFRVLSLFLLSAEDMLRDRSLIRIQSVERASRFNSECPTRPAIIFCLEDLRCEKRKLEVSGLVAFIELSTRLQSITNPPLEDLSTIPVLLLSRYALLPSLLSWLEEYGLAPEYFHPLSHSPQDRQPPWLCVVSPKGELVPLSDEARRILGGPPFCDPPGNLDANARALINVVIAKAGARFLQEAAPPRQWGRASMERVVAFWLGTHSIDY
ncbi:hypothetical protein QBC32DRAFT_2067 [Pseudoneurospora amorphoporcata]|uniref:Uncharacterized protein n=1 Tax=Pseudoneurospora amorphoporcata TaxID=241081 RepID=A0AAN6SJY0_9PEZI|nr:hypothetical protein QBC32DRAFT_2067 [Pseudoneurospora amorphoporcata]